MTAAKLNPSAGLRGTAWALVALVLGLPLLALVATIGALHSEAGSAWVLSQVPGLQVTAPRGALLGDHFGADRVNVTWAGSEGGVTLDAVALRGVKWRWWVRSGVWVGLQAESMTVHHVQVRTGPSTSTPLTAPPTLRLAFELQLARVEIASLLVDDFEPLHAVQASGVHIGGAAGALHRVESVAFEWDRLRAAGHAQIGADRPFALELALALQSSSATPWSAELRASGPLAGFDLQATLRGVAKAGREAPALDAQVQVLPFAPWQLGTLNASTKALDLSALSSRGPQTRLSGHAVVMSQGMSSPIGAQVEFDNALPGRWDEGRLPLRRVQIELRADLAQRDRVELSTFDLQFGSTSAAAGRWRGSGVWQGGTFTLDTRMADLRPQLLDGRAAAMVLSGPLALVLRGLPSPADLGTTPAEAATTTPARTVEAEFRAQLDGALDAVAQPVSLAVEGQASAQHLVLRKLHVTSGSASADLSASAQRAAGRHWLVRSTGRLADFDPVPWLPGPEGSAWRKGRHRLNAGWTLDLALPADAPRLPTLQLLQTLQGEGLLEIDNSQLAGVPVQARLQIGKVADAAQPRRRSATGELRLAGNVFTLTGQGDPTGSGEADRWRVEVHAGALARLAPLAALHPALVQWAPKSGAVDATLAINGRWPQVHTEGTAALQDLRAGTLSIARGSATWSLDTGPNQPIDLHAELTGIASGNTQLAVLRGDLRGTLQAHRMQLDLAAPLNPPVIIERMLGLRTRAGTQAQLSADGRWEAAPGGGGTWSGRVQRLTAGVWDGQTERRAVADASWLDSGELRAELQVDARGNVTAAHAAAGQATLAGGGALRWDDIRYGAGARQAEFELHAEILPIAVAPLLQRAQTGMQWGGDLRLAARVDVRAGERFDAEISVRRHDGDLVVVENGATQALGLSDVALSLTAHDGTWLVVPLFAGRNLGTMTGAVTVHAAPQQRWPQADAKVDGALHVSVPDLAVWARWVPPGWRIQGEMSSTAGIGGRFGAPEYWGELRGSGIGLRNLLQGMDYSDGEVQIALKGDNAQIERLTVRGGDGTLSAEGSATFGSAPQARLKAAAQHFRVLGRIDRRLVVSGDATLSLQVDRLRLDGRLGIDSGLFDLSRSDAPTLDSDVTVHRDGPAAAARAEPAAPSPIVRTAAVAIDIDLGDKLQLRGHGIDTKLKGRLKVSTPGGRLAVNGSVSAEDGTYAAYGQKLEIERGVVAFAGPLDNPRLDVLALRPNLDARVGVAITGSAQNPRIKLYSEPDMSDTDKLSWLVLGRGPDGLGRTDTALLQSAAVALLAGEGEGPTDKVLHAIGLDELSVRQSDGDVRETVISLGKQLSRRWYIGYERGVNATAGNWQLVYRVARHFTLRAQSGEDNSLDVIWTWRFGEDPLKLGLPPMTKSKPPPP